jgi:hypothetical protein
MFSMLVMILIIPSSEVNQSELSSAFTCHTLLQGLRQISSELTMLFLYHV